MLTLSLSTYMTGSTDWTRIGVQSGLGWKAVNRHVPDMCTLDIPFPWWCSNTYCLGLCHSRLTLTLVMYVSIGNNNGTSCVHLTSFLVLPNCHSTSLRLMNYYISHHRALSSATWQVVPKCISALMGHTYILFTTSQFELPYIASLEAYNYLVQQEYLNASHAVTRQDS